MRTSKVVYQGNLRPVCTHLQSGSQCITDAPVDNQGKREAFSPTDTVATGLANCMLTVIGIKANDLGENMYGTLAHVTKILASNPWRTSRTKIERNFPKGISEKNKKILERTARTCPVALSLHTDIIQDIQFNWQ